MSKLANQNSPSPVRAGLIGLGDFGHTFWLQAQHMPGMQLAALCDKEAEETCRRLQESRPSSGEIRLCDSAQEARTAMQSGMVPLVQDGRLLAELDIDVIVEASGSPEAGATHGLAALAGGKHVVMVNKETACTVGYALAAVAAEEGLNFAMADGDQPRQNIGFSGLGRNPWAGCCLCRQSWGSRSSRGYSDRRHLGLDFR